jgi:two-component system, sensor histidine kinase
MTAHNMYRRAAMQLDPGVPMVVEDEDTRPVATRRLILAVDDTPANLVALEAALAPLQRQVVSASSGEEALARLMDQEFALVILDVAMPGMDGFETARLIRGRARTRHLPIIFLSAYDHDEPAMLHAYRLGAVDFLRKPVVPEMLCAKAAVFVTLQERTEQLAAERMEREFDLRRREYETEALRRERDREHAAKAELANLNEALAEADRRKDSFIAILAHELRNPLAPIRTCIDLIRQDPTKPPSSRMLEVLDRQTNVLSRLIDDLLDLSRIKADKIALRPEPVDLVDVVDAAVTAARPLIEQRRHALVFEPPAQAIRVIADTVRIQQVVMNLLSNAARYSPPAGRIELSCGMRDDCAFVRVTDHGIGIPLELQDSIFDMFVQERVRSDGSGGLGLGLALARRLVELHHGTIRVHSEGRARGSTFELEIPLAGSPLALPPHRRTRDMPPLANLVRTPRAVVVDDNDDARELLCELLAARGFEVLGAADGLVALELIQAQRPDLALVDLGLPGLDGYALVEELRRQCPELPTRLIALTGYGDVAHQERTRQAGFHAHLIKPASAEAILACIAESLDRSPGGPPAPSPQLSDAR